MATRRTPCTAVLIGLAVALAFLLPVAAHAQEFGTVPPTVPPTDAASTSTTAAVAADDGEQTVVDGGPAEERPLITESRKIVAIIGALVVVALLLTLMTIRYWRATRPVAVEKLVDDDEAIEGLSALLVPPGAPAPLPVDTGEFTLSPTVPTGPAVAATDHGPDVSWEPRGTGEHDAISVPGRPAIARPGPEGRRAVLSRRGDG